MPRFMTFFCPELDTTYEAVYQELADFLEMEADEVAERFAPDDAVARVRYHRRQHARRNVQIDLAEALEIPSDAVFAACGEEGARILLEALHARDNGSRWSMTVTPAASPVAVLEKTETTDLIDEIEDLMCR